MHRRRPDDAQDHLQPVHHDRHRRSVCHGRQGGDAVRRLETAGTADGERGGISVLVAILMVALLGFAAVAVDVGMLYAERTQLRNGADAAAIAVAQKCARGRQRRRLLHYVHAGPQPRQQQRRRRDQQYHIPGPGQDSRHRHSDGRRPGSRQGAQPGLALLRARHWASTTPRSPPRPRCSGAARGRARRRFPLAFSICQVKNHVDGEPAAAAEPRQRTPTRTACTARPEPRFRAASAGSPAIRACAAALIDLAVAEAGSDPGNSYPGVMRRPSCRNGPPTSRPATT